MAIFLSNILRGLSFSIDQLLSTLIPPAYNLIMLLARMEIFDKDIGYIRIFTNNVYALLGVFMLFRLAFSLINTIVNPDLLVDEQKGFQKIITRTMIALTLIVAIPFAFNFAMRVQGMVIKENLFMKFFMGTSGTYETAGEYLADQTIKSFLLCDTSECINDKNYSDAYSDMKYFQLGVYLNDTKRTDGEYVYTYYWGLSTICLGYVLLMLIVFSMDIALRTVKLGFLQIISPIAVVSYIDPKSTEGGFFSKWIKVVQSTYLNLFIRIAAISFFIFIMSLFKDIIKSDFYEAASGGQKIFIIPLLIVGTLMFVKEAPKMIGDLFGVEDVGMGEFAKRAAKVTGLATGAVGVIGGGAFGGVAGSVMGGKGGFLRGAMKGMGSAFTDAKGAGGDVGKQFKGMFSSGFKAVGTVGKGIKGDSFSWGPKSMWDSYSKKAQYESKLAMEKEKYDGKFAQIDGASYTPTSQAEAYSLADKFGLTQADVNNQSDAWKNALDTIGKVSEERRVMNYSDNFANAFAAAEYSKVKSRNLNNRVEAMKATGATANNTQLAQLISDAGRAAGTAETLKGKFEAIQKDYDTETEDYAGIRAADNRKKAAGAADPFAP